MSDVPTLLPPNSTPFERALSRTLGRFNPPAVVPALWNAATCPPAVLPFLALALSVDEWDQRWSIDKKRNVIAAARYIHQHKGTPAAVRRALASVGQPDAEIIERANCIRHNGTATRNGLYRRRGRSGWATYAIVLKRPVTIDQAQQIQRILAAVQRQSIELLYINYSQAALRRNGVATRNGTYTRGAVANQLT